MIRSKMQTPLIIMLSITFPNAYGQITPVLDGYAYELYNDVTIDNTNDFIIINTDMSGCEQPNGNTPLDTTVYALVNGSEYIGLNQTRYDIESQKVYFTSETSNLLCDNGVYVDTIFEGIFE